VPVTVFGRNCNAIDREASLPPCGWFVFCAMDLVTYSLSMAKYERGAIPILYAEAARE
jgi:hypothetical protein